MDAPLGVPHAFDALARRVRFGLRNTKKEQAHLVSVHARPIAWNIKKNLETLRKKYVENEKKIIQTRQLKA